MLRIMVIFVIFTDADALPVANFLNEGCETGGVSPSDPLYFTCKIYKVVLLRVIFPTDNMEFISIGDTVKDVKLPLGFEAVHLTITEVGEYERNFSLLLSIDSASYLNGGNITCDNTTSLREATAGCPIGMSSFKLFASAL